MRTRITKHQHLCILRNFILVTGLYLCTCVIGCAPLGTGSHPEPDYLYNSRSRSLQTPNPDSLHTEKNNYEYILAEYSLDTPEKFSRFLNGFAQDRWRFKTLIFTKQNPLETRFLVIFERQEQQQIYRYSVVEYLSRTAETLTQFINLLTQDEWRLSTILERNHDVSDITEVFVILERQER